jgi:hypothetical protein
MSCKHRRKADFEEAYILHEESQRMLSKVTSTLESAHKRLTYYRYGSDMLAYSAEIT